MAFYDFVFIKRNKYESNPTALGRKIYSVRYRKIIKILTELCETKTPKNDLKILELGPGSGIFLAEVLAKGLKYECIEGNPTNSKHLAKTFKVKCINSIFPPLTAPDNEYDIIFMDQVFEHMPSVEKAEWLIREAKRVLKKGGIICSVSPDFLIWGKEFINGDYTHKTYVTINLMREYLENFDFIVSKNCYLSGFFIGNAIPTAISWSILILYPAFRLIFLPFAYLSIKLYKWKVGFLRSVFTVGKKAC